MIYLSACVFRFQTATIRIISGSLNFSLRYLTFIFLADYAHCISTVNGIPYVVLWFILRVNFYGYCYKKRRNDFLNSFSRSCRTECMMKHDPRLSRAISISISNFARLPFQIHSQWRRNGSRARGHSGEWILVTVKCGSTNSTTDTDKWRKFCKLQHTNHMTTLRECVCGTSDVVLDSWKIDHYSERWWNIIICFIKSEVPTICKLRRCSTRTFNHCAANVEKSGVIHCVWNRYRPGIRHHAQDHEFGAGGVARQRPGPDPKFGSARKNRISVIYGRERSWRHKGAAHTEGKIVFSYTDFFEISQSTQW